MRASGSPGRLIGQTTGRKRKNAMIASPMITFLVRSAKYRISPRRLIGSGSGRPPAETAPGTVGTPWGPCKTSGVWAPSVVVRVVLVLDRGQQQLAEPRVREHDFRHERAGNDHTQAQRQAGDLRQHCVPERVLAHESARGAERFEVARVVGLELVDDHVPHPDGPTAEPHEEE